MSDSLAQFNAEIERFSKKILPAQVVTFQKKLVLQALRLLVMKTPVDTGRARGNWQVTIDTPAEGQRDVMDAQGQATIAAGLAALESLPPFATVWISNNVDYIEKLEHGSSRQAPEGMMAVTVEELRAMFREAA